MHRHEDSPDRTSGHAARTLELIRASQHGDPLAIETLFSRYFPRVMRIVSLRMGRRLAAFVAEEDVAQEVLLRVFRGLEDFEPRSEGSFRNWIALCVERELRNHERARTAAKRGGGDVRRMTDCADSSMLSEIFADTGPSPSEVASARELEEKVETAILALEPHHRELIVQRYLCEMTYVEIGEQLQLDESSVRKSCARAAAKVRERLAG